MSAPPPEPRPDQTTQRLLDIGTVVRNLPDHLPEIIALVDLSGILHWYNLAAEETLGWRSPEWIGRSILEITHPRDHRRLLRLASLGPTNQGRQARTATGERIVIRVASADYGWLALELIVAVIDTLAGGPLLLVTARLPNAV